MQAPDIIDVTIKVVKVFEGLGIQYYIGGSLASSAFGIARSTPLDMQLSNGVNAGRGYCS